MNKERNSLTGKFEIILWNDELFYHASLKMVYMKQWHESRVQQHYVYKRWNSLFERRKINCDKILTIILATSPSLEHFFHSPTP